MSTCAMCMHQEWETKSPDLASLGKVLNMIKNHEINTAFTKKGDKGKEKEEKTDSRRCEFERVILATKINLTHFETGVISAHGQLSNNSITSWLQEIGGCACSCSGACGAASPVRGWRCCAWLSRLAASQVDRRCCPRRTDGSENLHGRRKSGSPLHRPWHQQPQQQQQPKGLHGSGRRARELCPQVL